MPNPRLGDRRAGRIDHQIPLRSDERRNDRQGDQVEPAIQLAVGLAEVRAPEFPGRDVGAGGGVGADGADDVGRLGRRLAEELAAGRGVEEEVADAQAGADRARGRADGLDVVAFDLDDICAAL